MTNYNDEPHFSLTNEEFAHQFATKTLHPKWFSHSGHLRLGWYYVSKYGVETASQMLCEQILDFDIHVGKGQAYHETITIAYAHIIHARKANEFVNFKTFLNANEDLITNAKGIFAEHYSYDVLKNDKARRTYHAPDLKPFST